MNIYYDIMKLSEINQEKRHIWSIVTLHKKNQEACCTLSKNSWNLNGFQFELNKVYYMICNIKPNI